MTTTLAFNVFVNSSSASGWSYHCYWPLFTCPVLGLWMPFGGSKLCLLLRINHGKSSIGHFAFLLVLFFPSLLLLLLLLSSEDNILIWRHSPATTTPLRRVIFAEDWLHV